MFLRSFRAVVDPVGVPWVEDPGDCALPEGPELEVWEGEGDAVPEFESFLFLLVLFESLARESCSC